MSNSSIVPILKGVGGGNIKTPPKEEKKQISPALHWVFTLNNYTEDEIKYIVPIFKNKCRAVCFRKEIGGKEKTPHLQGYCCFNVKVRPLSVFTSISRIWWEKAKGTARHNDNYCSKDENVVLRFGMPKKRKSCIILNSQLYVWQKEIIKMIEEDADERTIIHIHGKPKEGKTCFLKYLNKYHEAIPLDGEKRHMFDVASKSDTDFFVIPLGKGEFFNKFEEVEKIKDGFFMAHFGTKGTQPFNREFNAHVIIMGNEKLNRHHPLYHSGKYVEYEIINQNSPLLKLGITKKEYDYKYSDLDFGL